MPKYNIKRLLKIVGIFICVITVAIGYFIQLSLSNYRSAVEKEKIAFQILEVTYRRRIYGYDYLLDKTERARRQWELKNAELRTITNKNQAEFKLATEQSLLSQIQQLLDESSRNFNDAVSYYESEQADLTQQTEASQASRFRTQLSIVAQETIASANELRTINRKAAEQALDNLVSLIAIIGSVYFLVLLVSFWAIWKNAVRLQLRQSRDETLLASIGDGVFAIDKSGVIILFNRAAEIITGVASIDAVGKHYDNVVRFEHEKTGEKVDAFIKTAMAGSKAYMSEETVLVRSDAVKLPVADSAAPIIVQSGEVEGVIVVFRDITAERQVEQAKEELLSLATHQLQTPLTAVKNLLSLYLDPEISMDDIKKNQFVEEAYKANDEEIKLVTDLLNVARVDSGRLKLNLKKVDIADLIGQWAKNHAIVAKEKGQNLMLDLSTQSLDVVVDPDRLRMAVDNLISNASKYNKTRGTITVGLHDHAHSIEISVTDTGTGISLEDQNKLFQKFSRVGENANNTQGTGLGLYLVKRIVDLHQGKIAVKSELGKGTTFIISLPKE